MFSKATTLCRQMGLTALVMASGISAAMAQSVSTASWQVSKVSGDAWISAEGVQKASLGDSETLRPGDTIRTGRNGRVLLTRGQETIMVSPNSIVAVPDTNKDNQWTTIVQQAGTILLEVEKRNVRHFEVETPYLVAAVKGTHFRVSVKGNAANVDVLRGQVDVANAKSGRHVLVLPGQSAAVTPRSSGISLSGAGRFNPVESGEPRKTVVQRVAVPKGGLTAPIGRYVRARADASAQSVGPLADHGKVHIGAPLGELKLNFTKVTHGLASDASATASAHGSHKGNTVWSSGELAPGNGAAKTSSPGNGNPAGGTANAVAIAGGGNSSNSNGIGNGGGNGNTFGVIQGVSNALGNGNGKGKGKN